MKPTPKGWPRLSTALYYKDPARMIDWLCQAYGFELRLKVEGDGGQIEHSELCFGEAVIMLSGERPVDDRFVIPGLSPLSAGANTQNLMLYVDDVEAHFVRARAAGAMIINEPQTRDYGDDYWSDRSYGTLDPEQHHWWFAQRLKTGAG
jgi:uncharacterized glyoxalase superfamily protein PhnB